MNSFFNFFHQKNLKKSNQSPQALFPQKKSLGSQLLQLFSKSASQKKSSEYFFQKLEEILITSDSGVHTSFLIIQKFQNQLRNQSPDNVQKLQSILNQLLVDMIPNSSPTLFQPSKPLFVFLALGANGTGKTTSIAKLAHLFKSQNLSVALAACDTFRAAATQQLNSWAKKIQIPIFSQKNTQDPAAILHDSIDSSLSKKIQILLVDTAGRFHTQNQLLSQLQKLARIILKKNHSAHAHHLLVLDASTGQNALAQAQKFHSSLHIHSILLSKLDSTAKGGIVLNLASQLPIPIQFVGTGENIQDLALFDKQHFVNSLLAF